MEHINQYLQYLSGTAEKYEESKLEPISLTDYMLRDMEHFNDRFQGLRACNNRVAFKGTEEEEIKPTTRVKQGMEPELTVTAQMLCEAKEGFLKLQELCSKVILQIEDLQAIMKFEEKEVEEPVIEAGLETEEEFYDEDEFYDEEDFENENQEIARFYNEGLEEGDLRESTCFMDAPKGRDSPDGRIEKIRRKEEIFFDDHTSEVFSFNARDQCIRMIDRIGRVKRFAYDENNHLVRMIDERGGFTDYSYDASNQVVQTIDRNGIATRFTYDSGGRITKVANATGDTRIYQYTENGKVAAFKDYDGKKVYYNYDSDGKLISKADTSGHEVSYRYDSEGRKIEQTDQFVITKEYSYDDAGRMNYIAYNHGPTREYEYDSNGRVVEIRNSDGSFETFTYDSFGNAICKVNREEEQKKALMNRNGEKDLLLYGLVQTESEEIHCIDEKQVRESYPELRQLNHMGNWNRTATEPISRIENPSVVSRSLHEGPLFWEAIQKQEARRVVGSNESLESIENLMKRRASKIRKLQFASLLG